MLTTRYTDKSLIVESDGCNRDGELVQGQPVAKAIIPKDRIKHFGALDEEGNDLWVFDGGLTMDSADVFYRVWQGTYIAKGCRFVLDHIIQ